MVLIGLNVEPPPDDELGISSSATTYELMSIESAVATFVPCAASKHWRHGRVSEGDAGKQARASVLFATKKRQLERLCSILTPREMMLCNEFDWQRMRCVQPLGLESVPALPRERASAASGVCE